MSRTGKPPFWQWYEPGPWCPEWLHLRICTFCRGGMKHVREQEASWARIEPGETWRARAGRIVLDPFNAHGEVVTAPMDRRWLWRIESILGAAYTTDTQHQLVNDLRAYLVETCEHHWRDYEGDEDIPAHRQCMWCAALEWAADKGTAS